MSSPGGATKEIILGLGLFFCEVLLYIVVRPALTYTMTILVGSYTYSPTATLAAQMGLYTEAAWSLLVISTLIVFVILPAFRREPSQYGY